MNVEVYKHSAKITYKVFVICLQLPNSYVGIDREEMEYLEGGISISKKWYGFSIWFNSRENEGLLLAIGAGSMGTWFTAELLAAGVITLPGAIPFGIIAAALGISGVAIAAAKYKNNGSGFSANFTPSGGMYGIW